MKLKLIKGVSEILLTFRKVWTNFPMYHLSGIFAFIETLILLKINEIFGVLEKLWTSPRGPRV